MCQNAKPSQQQGTIEEPILCERCGYDLRGLGKKGHCPECNEEFDTDALLANQHRSVERILLALRILAIPVVLMVCVVLTWIILEDFLHYQRWKYDILLVMTVMTGTPILIIAWGIILIQLKKNERQKRPYYNTAQWNILPDKLKFWIYFDMIGIMTAFFFGWGNPVWRFLLNSIRSVM